MALCSRAVFQFRQNVTSSSYIKRCLFTKLKESIQVKEKRITGKQLNKINENTLSTNFNVKSSLKGSLTNLKAYVPPENIRDIIRDVSCKYFKKEDWKYAVLSDPTIKFKVLSEIISLTDHDVPNCELCHIKRMEDVIEFFEKEVKTTSPYDELAAGRITSLPKNLHIQLEAIRFDPKTDTMFNGRTAFPGSDTVVTSLKYRRKYADVKVSKEKAGYSNHYYDY